ncbi:zinc transporter ZntB [Parasphingorhabdus sp.]|uniref:zinc transporter ZntB n=1 Tax=Parasphingorhabdus sp. TaxID=2709688 RepID=UPI0030035BF5
MTNAPVIKSRVHDIEPEDGLLFGCILDGKGGGKLCNWAEIEATDTANAPLWLHLDNVSDRAETWLREKSGIPAPVVGALLAKESRPRSLRVDDGLLVILRGVNLNEGAEPEDMVALRMWVEPTRIITVRYERMMTPRDVLSDIIDGGHGVATTPDLFVALSERMSLKINDVIIELEDRLDALEAQVDSQPPTKLRSKIAESRQDTVALRRYLSPQREALANLQYDAPDWLDPSHRMSLRETADRTMRYLEDLDAARDRAIVVLDELANKMAESMNRTMYALSIVAAIFLPLSFLTGLLGINVGGMPGVDSDLAFWLTCAIMSILMVAEIYVLRRLQWI